MKVKELAAFLQECDDEKEIYIISAGGNILKDGMEISNVFDITGFAKSDEAAVIIQTDK